MRSMTLFTLLLMTAACSATIDRPPSYEMIEEPVDFYFDTDPRDQPRISNIAETLDRHFPQMSWRIGAYDPSERDGLVVQVQERQLRDVSAEQDCSDCLRSVTVFVIFKGGQRLGNEQFDDCSIYRLNGDCFAVRQLVSTIDTLVSASRPGAGALHL